MHRAKTNTALRVGVTGGIGSGKSTVCSMLAECGRIVLSADEIARGLTEENQTVRERIRKAFGHDVYGSDGSMDRKKLARIVFADAGARVTLNRIVHPLVIEEIERRTARLPLDPRCSYLVVEAALIYESGLDRRLDYTVVVDAPREVRIARVVARDKCSREEVLARMRAQMPVQEKLERADFIIANDGTENDLQQRVVFLDTLLSQIALRTPGS